MSIHLLSPETRMRIAAGEVVTNPASVVKELIENALDAKATKIRIQISNGGKDEIVVTDNGEGMEDSDILLCTDPHTTSKIHEWDDLLAIESFGFRGEALASIASVSEFRITSRTSNEPLGRSIEVRGGEKKEIRKENASVGTKVEVHNLFFNVPARRKFLKSSTIESRMVIELVEKFMISVPHLSFELVKDREVIYTLPPSSLKERMLVVFSMVSSGSLRRVEHSSGSYSVKGYISTPDVNRPNRTGIFTFVNKRMVRHPMLYSALDHGYGEMLPKGRYPMAVIMIDVPSEFLDVNVHPQKTEVKFARNEQVFSLVADAVKQTLSMEPLEIQIADSTTPYPNIPSNGQNHTLPIPRQLDMRSSIPNPFSMEDARKGSVSYSEEKRARYSLAKRSSIGVLKGRFILCDHPNGLSIIDHHAAHEQLLYQKIKDQKRTLEPQVLLSPLILEIDQSALLLLTDHQKVVDDLGFRWVQKKNRRVEITCAPTILPIAQIETTWIEVLEQLRFWEMEGTVHVLDRIFQTIACHAAIRSGEPLSYEDAEYLLRQMEETSIFSCPHGRPIEHMIRMEELDRFFRR